MRATSLRNADVAGAFSTGAAGVSEVGIFFIRYAALRSELSRDPYWVRILHPKGLLKFVASAGQARRKGAKNRSVWGIHEDFEPLCNAAWPSAAEFQQAPKKSFSVSEWS